MDDLKTLDETISHAQELMAELDEVIHKLYLSRESHPEMHTRSLTMAIDHIDTASLWFYKLLLYLNRLKRENETLPLAD